MKNTAQPLRLKREDAKLLNEHQHPRFDSQTGIVWIEDGTIGGSHSAHPNVEANKYSRRKYAHYTESHGFLFSPEVFCSSDLDRIAARYCACYHCTERRTAKIA